MSKKEIDVILDKLNEIHSDVKKINEEKIPEIKERLATVETRTKVWSGLAGVIGGALVFISDKFVGR